MYRILKLKESEELDKKLTETEEFRYITNHGIGPGTLPDGVYIRSEELPGGKTAIYLNRALSDEELEKYDIKPEWLQESDEEEEVENDAEQIQDDIEANQDLEDTIDTEENQEENPVEEESELDKKLDELREVLVDLDLNLYRVASKENPKDVVYIIGKVAENSDDILVLVDTKPEEINNDIEPEEKPIIDDIEPEEIKEDEEEHEDDIEPEETEEEQRFDFVQLPKSFDEINKLNPRYGEEITPDHDAIMSYLMNCLIEVNPEAAEELQSKEEPDENLPVPDAEELIPGEEDLEDED